MITQDYERARSALAFMSPDDRDTWVRMGMAVKDGFGDEGFEIWDAWSRQSDRYSERDAKDVWRSLKAGGGVTLGTLFHEAMMNSWRDNGTRPTHEEIAERRRVAAERAAKEKDAIAGDQADAARQAQEIWTASSSAPDDHAYLLKKQVRAHGLRVHEGALVIPVRDASGLHSLQFIAPDGGKRFLKGGRASGCYHLIGEPNGVLCIAEGYATVASIHECTGYAAAVTLTAGNLKPVTLALRKRFPDIQLIVCSDNDVGTEGNPGLTKAREAAEAVGAALRVPDFGEDRPMDATDFNDMYRLRGKEAVRDVVARVEHGDAVTADEVLETFRQRRGNGAASARTQKGNDMADEANEQARLRAVQTFIQSDDLTKGPRPRPQTDILIDIGLNVSKALFCGDDDRPYAVIRDRSEVWGVGSKRFREWLRGSYFTLADKGANANSVRDAVETIAAKAQFSGDKRKVFLRTADADGKIYIDLTDDDWRVVEVDAKGWRVLDQSPVMFTRRGTPAPLPVPERDGSLSELWPLLNVPEKYRSLVSGWLLAALCPSGPYPILVFQGEEGTAKTTAALMLRSLCDPAMVPLRAPTRDEKDFLVGCIGNWCVCIDNVSGLQPWLSDALCRLSTGGGFAARTLYTDCDETSIQIERPVILNGIDVGAVRGDLVSRTMTLTLDTIEEDKRKDLDDLKARFEKARPRILGALFTGLAQAVREKPNVKLAHRPRMLGFARLVVAAETALGFEAGAFMQVYTENLSEGASVVLDDPVAQALIVFVTTQKQWIGTADQLLNAIGPKEDDHSRSVSSWPKTGRGMAERLKRFAPALRRVGIDIGRPDPPREPGTGARLIELTGKAPAQSSQPSQPSQPRRDAGRSRDGSTPCGDSTVTDRGQLSRTATKNSSKNKECDGRDGCDGSAGRSHGGDGQVEVEV